jgi:antitoxin MazE
MSIVTLTRWGNSVGVRIPAVDIKTANAYVGKKFELSLGSQGGFVLTPVKKPREGWLEAFNKMADARDSKGLLPDMENNFDENEWTW